MIYKKYPNKICPQCNKSFEIKVKHPHIVFCSVKCSGLYRRGIPAWNKGKKMSLKTRMKMAGRSGSKSSTWKGGKTIRRAGYVWISCPDHPHKSYANYVYEHRLVMERHIGRYLKKEEVVHHINKNTSDNSIDNLILFKNNSEHIKHHLKERYARKTSKSCISTSK